MKPATYYLLLALAAGACAFFLTPRDISRIVFRQVVSDASKEIRKEIRR